MAAVSPPTPVISLDRARSLVEAIDVAYRLRLGEAIADTHPFAWFTVFDSEDLADFISEMMALLDNASGSQDSDNEIEAVLHEWHESYLAIQNPELKAAFEDSMSTFRLYQKPGLYTTKKG